MPPDIVIVTGTDTGIGKTVFAAGLTGQLRASYWKPVQSGLDSETDSEVVHRLTGRPTLPEALRLKMPASPNLAAAAEGRWIDDSQLQLPPTRPLVIEGVGGLMVPLNDESLILDVFARWNCPVILCASTRLGTINHSLLSLMALSSRRLSVLGVAFIGEPQPQVEDTIRRIGKVRRLGRLPFLPSLNSTGFQADFDAAFPLGTFDH
jgi:dethiobiotin synthetase